MHKHEKITLITKVHTEKVKPALIAAEIGDFDLKPSDSTNHVRLNEAIAWIDSFTKIEVKHFDEVWQMLKPDVWACHKMFGLHDLIEMKMLRIVTKELKEKWVKRPGAIRRTYGSQAH